MNSVNSGQVSVFLEKTPLSVFQIQFGVLSLVDMITLQEEHSVLTSPQIVL